jgi:hypothetical protein
MVIAGKDQGPGSDKRDETRVVALTSRVAEDGSPRVGTFDPARPTARDECMDHAGPGTGCAAASRIGVGSFPDRHQCC